MSYYYCDTCQKTLQRNEQRHNQESSGPMVIGQMSNIPGHPLVGFRPVHNVVRCAKCGSDARVCYTKEEQEVWEKDKQVWILIIIIVVGLIAVGISYLSREAARMDEEHRIEMEKIQNGTY